ncbi:NPCBM/NEW2 domain-containing protein [Paenibacillus anseongense]|uniref:NPCBM/NEW2 domain-containing protein n=1 Tax=Paenibacillus anseongense TaxID=2682845 RepID=UPI002DBA9EF4|nr:NPCBM/NEW2 domain-containing protein [Paenibacillus anseongense]MEC0270169.1 NPCBM/NEW2 domain-containing protein [Paenibacillus anseongense]
MRKTTLLIITTFVILTACSKKEVVNTTQTQQTATVQQQNTSNMHSEPTKTSEPIKQEKKGEAVFLSDLQFDKIDGTYKKGIISFNKNEYGGGLQVDGHPYAKGISARLMSGDNGSVQYVIDGTFKTFSGKIGIDDGSQSQKGNTGQVLIYFDEKEVYRSEMLKQDQTAEFNLKIDGVKMLKVVLSASKTNGSLDPAIIFNIVEPKLNK